MQDKLKRTFVITAIIEIVIAIGILSFWIAFFSTDMVSIEDPKLKETYLAFESAFPLPDGWLVISLIIGGTGLLKKKNYGYYFSLISGSSLIFLGLVDISFNVRQGIYVLGAGEAILNISINLMCLISGIFILSIICNNKNFTRRSATAADRENEFLVYSNI
mgnify:CR=1 FL=1